MEEGLGLRITGTNQATVKQDNDCALVGILETRFGISHTHASNQEYSGATKVQKATLTTTAGRVCSDPGPRHLQHRCSAFDFILRSFKVCFWKFKKAFPLFSLN